jgi:hypothetical protein
LAERVCMRETMGEIFLSTNVINDINGYHIAARTMQDIPAMIKPISWSDLVDRYLKRYTDNTETGSADAMLITTK